MVGQHLLFDGEDYRLSLTAAETKTGRPYVAAVLHELTPYIERWLQVRRSVLPLGRVNTNHIDDQGEMDEGGEHEVELFEA